MTSPTFDVETADRTALITWLLDDADLQTLEEWGELWLRTLSSYKLREWVRDALPDVECEDCGTLTPKAEAHATTAGRIVCDTCAEEAV